MLNKCCAKHILKFLSDVIYQQTLNLRFQQNYKYKALLNEINRAFKAEVFSTNFKTTVIVVT